MSFVTRQLEGHQVSFTESPVPGDALCDLHPRIIRFVRSAEDLYVGCSFPSDLSLPAREQLCRDAGMSLILLGRATPLSWATNQIFRFEDDGIVYIMEKTNGSR